jgi:hypothetical protein
MPEIDFSKIRPHRGTKHGGFEELSVQLFRSSVTDAVEFTRVEGAGGDGGVEAFVTMVNSKKIGLQAKYFDRLDTKQWRQISESITSAFENHPNLIEYRVAVPLDRTPGQKSKWDSLTKQWKALALKNVRRRTRPSRRMHLRAFPLARRQTGTRQRRVLPSSLRLSVLACPATAAIVIPGPAAPHQPQYRLGQAKSG